ncbi:TonB-dependent receptor [Taibaiella koreensis]|uniref:TonB-dependent receptor n=1 Tax=Taibaiella koreensis TaxID=1268548 RepID=UPI000E59A06C|nr:TonB-dependent receptor [Taibaiella koreensis]
MKPLTHITIAICLLSAIKANAQSLGTISGKVREEHNQPLEAVTVSLLKASDSSLVKAAITDTSGVYELEGETSGSYLLSFSSMGYQKQYLAPFTPDATQGYQAPEVKLAPETRAMEGVVITSRKPMVEVKPGKVVFNVEGSINATGSNALELLQKSPGVMVDNNDNISMKGRSGIKVYIDGKMTQLDSKGLADYLKSINSSDVEAIELISNPGAKFDASGNAGIINIRLKKNRKFGTNGSVELGYMQGITPKGNGAVSLNYRDKKVNIFSNISGATGLWESKLDIHRPQGGSIYDQKTVLTQGRKNLNLKAGADYFIDNKNTVGLMFTGGLGGGSFDTDGTTDISDEASGAFQKKLVSSNRVPITRNNGNVNLNYRYANDSSGTTISFDADYGKFHSTGTSYQPNNYFDANNNLLYTIINGNKTPTDIDIYTAKLDLEHKLGKGTLGYGVKTAWVKTSNTFDFFKYTDNTPVKDLSQSNSFAYSENVNAAYVNYSLSLGKQWSLQAGLRMEQTNSKGELTRADGTLQDDNTVKRNYLDFFPNAVIGYTINESHALGLSYTRRIDRPSYQDLNPFENKIDQMTYEKGNAFLRPQYSNNIELSYTYKSMLNFTLGYSHAKDYATQITDTINGNATFIQVQNIASQNMYTFGIGTPIPIAKWWNGYVNFWYNYQTIKGDFNHTSIDLKGSTYGLYMQNTFTLGKGFSAEVGGWFSGEGIEGTWQYKPMGSLDIGVQKRFLNERASVKLSMSDVLYTNRFRGYNRYGGVNLDINQRNENRMVRLNFSYRFGSSEIKGARQRKTASESEGKRIK